jgi:hypothetical protein
LSLRGAGPSVRFSGVTKAVSLAVAVLLIAPATAADAKPPAPERVVEVLDHVESGLVESKYTHATRVDVKKGRYEFDCSGMVSWVLARAAPKAHGAVVWRAKTSRPLARDFYAQIAAQKPGPPHYGWSRVSRVADAQPGDVIAWLRPKEIRSVNTGHVAFLVRPPEPAPGVENGFLLRVADASRYQHQDDTRSASGRTGFGVGTILVIADPDSGAPVAYGWVGLSSAWILSTRMAIGRVGG